MFFFNKNKAANKIGYVNDQNGIINRCMREGDGWHSHLANTKKYIVEAARQTAKKDVAVVLGSGWWLDVPVVELSKMFAAVYMVDINHPMQIKHKAAKYKNIHLINYDISGGAADFAYKAVNAFTKNKIITDLQQVQLNVSNWGLPDDCKISFTASVNILNQLDIIIVDFLNKKKIYNTKEIARFRTLIQQTHINELTKTSACLITDYEELSAESVEKINSVQAKKLLHVELPKGQNRKKWLWEFDKSMTYNDKKITFMNVCANFYPI